MRKIYIYNDINYISGQYVCQKLYEMNRMFSRFPIVIHINSPGGYLDSVFSIVNTMQSIESPVVTIVDGMALSGGAFIAMAGTPGLRFAMPYSQIMIHELLAGTTGKYSVIKDQQEGLDQNMDLLKSMVSTCTGKTIPEIEKDLVHDKYFIPEMARTYGPKGIIDHVSNSETMRLFSNPDNYFKSQRELLEDIKRNYKNGK
jgi:ATP-dependent Clp protease, protease subunit